MTGASPITTILTKTAWQSYADPCIEVTGLAPVMLSATCFFYQDNLNYSYPDAYRRSPCEHPGNNISYPIVKKRN